MAATGSGDVLFQRGLNSDENEDIWDDTALIKAYDEAVSVMKVKAAGKLNNGISESGTEEVIDQNKNQKKKKKKTKNKRKARKWHVGESCRAKFSEDGLIYEAEIISMDEATGTCRVRYVGYGNEEDQELQDLIPQQRKKKRESDIETDSGMEWKESANNRSPDHKSRLGFNNPYPFPGWPGFPGEPMMPPPQHFPGYAGSMPPPPPSMFSSSRIPNIPNIPPPPPPPMLSEMSESDNEALCSMLMSWYMSGYHTGYYQGLQQGRKASAASSPFVNR